MSGWLGPAAISTTIAFDRFQKASGVQGGVCEIGVHHGRFFILLALLRRADEFGVAIDVFDIQEFNQDKSGSGNLQAFNRNLDTWGCNQNVIIHKADSAAITNEVMKKLSRGEGIRIFSVDGSHTAEYTSNDILLANSVLSVGGMIFVDDFLNADWPGVLEGVVKTLSAHPDIAPVCYGGNKIVLCRREDHDRLLKFVRNDLVPLSSHAKQVKLCGTDCYVLALEAPRDVFTLVGRPCVASATFEHLFDPADEIGAGWGTNEGGRWTIGPEASLNLRVTSPGAVSALFTKLATFGVAKRGKQELTYMIGDSVAGSISVDNNGWGCASTPVDSIFHSGDKIDFRIRPSTIDSPRSCGEGADDRPLGVKIKRIALIGD